MTEIEIKAHVANPEKTAQNIASFAVFTGETHKRDTYWTREEPLVKVRVREESGILTVTYKKKELRGETEVNDEREFTISDRSAFETFIADSGFSPASYKEKITKRWVIQSDSYGEQREKTLPEIGIELSLVDRLGWFIELEALADNPGENEIARIRGLLLETLDRCCINREAIETRYYTEMLAELESGT